MASEELRPDDKPEVIGAETTAFPGAEEQAVFGLSGNSLLVHVPELIDNYVDSGLARRDRIRMVVRVSILFFIFIIIGFIVVTFLPELMKNILKIGIEMEKEKDNPALVVASFLLVMFYAAVPAPGRAAFNLVLGYVYGWAAFLLILIPQTIGAYIAFVVARCAWPYLAKRGGCLRRCCFCCVNRDGKPAKMVLFIVASLAAVDDKPFQTTFLLVLSPVPTTFLAYILGAKCHKLNSINFLAAITLGGCKVIMPVYLAHQAKDMQSIIDGGTAGNRTDMIVQTISLVIAIVVFIVITSRAYFKIQEMQEQLKTRDRSNQQDDSAATTLAIALCNEYGESAQGQEQAKAQQHEKEALAAREDKAHVAAAQVADLELRLASQHEAVQTAAAHAAELETQLRDQQKVAAESAGAGEGLHEETERLRAALVEKESLLVEASRQAEVAEASLQRSSEELLRLQSASLEEADSLRAALAMKVTAQNSSGEENETEI